MLRNTCKILGTLITICTATSSFATAHGTLPDRSHIVHHVTIYEEGFFPYKLYLGRGETISFYNASSSHKRFEIYNGHEDVPLDEHPDTGTITSTYVDVLPGETDDIVFDIHWNMDLKTGDIWGEAISLYGGPSNVVR